MMFTDDEWTERSRRGEVCGVRVAKSNLQRNVPNVSGIIVTET
jgi:hypothetical protein